MSEEKVMLYVRGKGHVTCQRERPCYMPEENGYFICQRKGHVVCQKETAMLYVKGKGHIMSEGKVVKCQG